MIIDCISDLHGHYPELEGGDLLIIAGDVGLTPEKYGVEEFDNWLGEKNYKKRIVIAGNHDTLLQAYSNIGFQLGRTAFKNAEYLCDSGTEYEHTTYISCIMGDLPIKNNLKIWGSPWVKSFIGMNPNAKAFTVDTEEKLAEKWALIPDDVDILVTHSPPNGMRDEFDEVTKWGTKQFNGGSLSLQKRIMNIVRPKKRLLVCGHIHESYGILNVSSAQYDLCTWKIINASHVNECYQPVNRPIRIIL